MPNPAILAIDNKDGTGIKIEVTFINAPPYLIQFRLPSMGWTDLLSINATGFYDVGPPDIEIGQLYQFRISSPADQSNIVSIAGTASNESIHFRAILALAARMADTPFEEINSNDEHRVYVQLFPDDNLVKLPCMLLTPVATENLEMMDDSTQKIQYPVMLDLLDRNDADYDKPLPMYLRWRQQVHAEFRRQLPDNNGILRALPNAPEVSRIIVAPRPIVDPDLPAYQFIQSGFLIWLETYLTTVGQE